MKISVVTVCKNSESSIKRTIESVIGQTYKDIEYIIVDGDSQDKTKEIVFQYVNVAKIISEPDDGIYEAMNKGVNLSTGSFINFLNSDDYFYDKNVVQDVVDFISEHPNCNFVYGDTHIRPNPKLSVETSLAKSPLPENIPEAMITFSLFIQGAIFFKADLFSRLGFFDESYKISADYEWFARLIQDETSKPCYYPRTILSYYQGGLSSRDIRATLTEMFEIQNKISIFQTEHGLKNRICKLQESIIDLQDFIHGTQELSEKRRVLIAAMETEVSAAKAQISAMETSKFWKLRTAWFRLKKAIKCRI